MDWKKRAISLVLAVAMLISNCPVTAFATEDIHNHAEEIQPEETAVVEAEITEPVVETTLPAEEPEEPVEETTIATEETEPAVEETEPATEPTTEETVEPTEETTESTEETTIPTEATEPTVDPTMPSEVMEDAPTVEETPAVSDYTYTVLNGTFCEITGYTGTDTELILPSEINGYIVHSIADEAFKGNLSLCTIVFSETVVSMGTHVFSGCVNLTNVYLNEGLTHIGSYAFEGCYAMESIDVPGSVTCINRYAFSRCIGLKTILLSDGLIQIKAYAFEECTGLEYVDIPDSVTTISARAFNSCLSLTEVEYPVGWTIVLSEADEYDSLRITPFSNCASLKRIEIPEGVTMIPENAFESMHSLSEIELPRSLKYIGDYAFGNCSNLETVVLHSALESIGYSAFVGCSSLARITVDDENKYYCNDADGVLFNKDKSELIRVPGMLQGTYIVPEGTINIADGAFSNCDLTKVILADTVTSIGNFSFSSCQDMEEITLPQKLTTIGTRAFISCSKLTRIDIPISVTQIGEQAFVQSGVEAVYFYGEAPQLPTALFGPRLAMAYYPKDNVTWTDGVLQLYKNFVTWVPYENEHVHSYDENHQCECGAIGGTCGENLTWNYDSNTGILTVSGTGDMYDYSATNPPWYPYRYSIASIQIGEGVSSIGVGAFSYTNVMEIVIPGNVKKVSANAFERCNGLTTVTIEEGVTELEANAFYASGLERVFIPASMEDMGYAFSWCGQLADVTLAEGITNIGVGTFYNCFNLTTLYIPDSVTTINSWAFDGCGMLKKLDIPSTVNYIGSYAFRGCTQFTEFEFPDGISAINVGTFEDCRKLEKVTIPGSVKTISGWVFNQCGALKSVTFEGDAPEMDASLFANITATAYYPAGNKTWMEEVRKNYGGTITWMPYGDSCKNGHTEVVDKAVSATCTTDGLTEGKHCSVCGDILVPQEVIPSSHNVVDDICTTCGVYGTCGENLKWMFDQNTGRLTISGYGAMYDYESPRFGENVAPWSSIAAKITDAVIEFGATYIGEDAFYGLDNILTLSIPESVSTVASSAYGASRKLTVMIKGNRIPTSNGILMGPAICVDVNRYGITEAGLFYCVSNDNTVTVSKYFGEYTETLLIPEKIEGLPVTEVAQAAFYQNQNFKFVTLPESIVVLNHYAFEDATSLIGILIPESVMKIGYRAFSGTSATVMFSGPTLPSSLLSGWNGNSLVITDVNRYGVTDDGFFYCVKNDDTAVIGKYLGQRKEVTVPAEVDGAPVLQLNSTFKNNAAVTRVVVSAGIKTISDECFYGCEKLTEVVLYESIESIGKSAFRGCRALETLMIPGSVETIGDLTLRDCFNMKYVVIDSDTLRDNLKYVEGAYGWNDGITVITGIQKEDEDPNGFSYILDKTGNITIIDYFGNQKDITIPTEIDGFPVTQIACHAFSERDALTGIVIPETIQYIGYEAFFKCTHLTTIQYNARNLMSLLPLSYVFADAGINGDGITLTIGNTVTRLPDRLFNPDQYTSSGTIKSGFYPNIVEIIFEPDSQCRSIGYYSFAFLENLEKVTFSGDAPNIDTNAFYSVHATAYYPDNNSTWTDDVLLDYGGTITWVPYEKEHVHSYDANHKCECGAIGGTCGENLTWTLDETGVLRIYGTGLMYDFATDESPWSTYRNQINEIQLPEGLAYIGEEAFRGLYRVKHVSIPKTVTEIGSCAFILSGLTAVALPEGLQTIGSSAFSDTKLKTVDIPDSVISIEDWAFSECNLESLYIPANVTKIGGAAFADNRNLRSIEVNPGNTSFRADANGVLYSMDMAVLYQCPGGFSGEYVIPEGVATLQSCAFRGCAGLTKVTIPDSVVRIYGQSIFTGCTGLKELILPNGLTNLCYAFAYGATQLEKVELPDKLKKMDMAAFYGCTSLTSITIPETVTEIDSGCFAETGLTSIVFRGSAPEIHETAFKEVTATAYYPANDATWTEAVRQNYGGTITWIPYENEHVHNYNENHQCACGIYGGACGENATWILDPNIGLLTISGSGDMDSFITMESVPWYSYREQIIKVNIQSGITSICDCGFWGCCNLLDIEIPDGVTKIGSGAFIDCSSLKSIIIPDGVTRIGEALFKNCTSLEKIKIPNSASVIDTRAFYRCVSLENITISNGVTWIGEQTFEGCESLKSITIQSGNLTIKLNAFQGCFALDTLRFEGNAPKLHAYAFNDVTATAYYPADNATWTADKFQNYGGTLTWIPYGEPVEEPLKITSQPENFIGAINSYATFTVSVNKEDVQYQWYYSSDGGEIWVKSGSTGNKTDTLTTQIKDYRLSQLYRCEITDSEGNKVTTQAVSMLLPPSTIEILHQPVDVYGAPAEKMTISLEATGEGLKYQWYYSLDGGETWSQSWSGGYNTAAVSPVLRAYNSGRLFKCLITDKNGNTEWSDIAKMELASSDVVIHSQPANYTGKANDLTSFTVVAEGTNLEYRWYYSDNGGETWQESYNTGYDKATLQVRLYPYRSGYLYKCQLISGGIVKAETEPAELRLLPQTAKILSHPMNAGAEVYKYVTFHVEATGENLQYQWQYSSDGGNTWTNSSGTGSTTDTIEVMVIKGRDGYKYRCQITDESGVPVNSQPATLRVGSMPAITSQPRSYTGAVGGTAVFTVVATGQNLQYQWQYSNNGGVSWTNSGMTGNKTASLTVVVTAARNGQQYRCVITNEFGSVISDAAILTIK